MPNVVYLDKNGIVIKAKYAEESISIYKRIF